MTQRARIIATLSGPELLMWQEMGQRLTWQQAEEVRRWERAEADRYIDAIGERVRPGVWTERKKRDVPAPKRRRVKPGVVVRNPVKAVA